MYMSRWMQFAFLLAFLALALILTGLNGYGGIGVFLFFPASLIFGVVGLLQRNPPSGP